MDTPASPSPPPPDYGENKRQSKITIIPTEPINKQFKSDDTVGLSLVEKSKLR